MLYTRAIYMQFIFIDDEVYTSQMFSYRNAIHVRDGVMSGMSARIYGYFSGQIAFIPYVFFFYFFGTSGSSTIHWSHRHQSSDVFFGFSIRNQFPLVFLLFC